jgi:hypothetical protein
MKIGSRIAIVTRVELGESINDFARTLSCRRGIEIDEPLAIDQLIEGGKTRAGPLLRVRHPVLTID